MVFWLILGPIFAYVCYRMAVSRNRPGGLWATLGFFFFFLPVIILAVIGRDKDNDPVPAPALAMSPVPSATVTDQLKQAKELLDTGAISAEEFDGIKRKLLGQA